jgi:flagellum-specific ATP synthase
MLSAGHCLMSEVQTLDLSRHLEKLKAVEPLTEFGIVEKIVGSSIESQGPNATVGSVCWLSNGERQFPVEVVGFSEGKVITMPLGKVEGVRQGNLLRVSGRTASIGMSESLRGRILDGLGRPIDSKPLPAELEQQALYSEPSNPMDRDPIREPIQTGVRSIDALLTCGMGQRIGIFGGSGVGKSTLLGMIAKYTSADINIIALVGERGREVREFIENDLGESGLQRSIVFVSTSDQPALVRIRAAFAATAAAEYFRDRGFNVMLMMDSVTRFAMAQREVGLAAGEPPSSKGYTPSVFSLLPRLLERSGKFSKGSITAFYTVLVEGDDMNDPIADSVRSILDGHIVLDRKLAGRGHYPCIDMLNSISRLMPQLVDESVKTAAYGIRDLLAVHKDSEDLINIGAYKKGSNPRIDRAIEKIDSINAFLKQRAEEPSTLTDARAKLLSLNQ